MNRISAWCDELLGCTTWRGTDSGGIDTRACPPPGPVAGDAGGEWCMGSRTRAFEPAHSSIIDGGTRRRATLQSGDLAFVTEGCGSWTKVD